MAEFLFYEAKMDELYISPFVIKLYTAFLSNQKSLASYIKRHACSNAKTEDLWAALEEGSGEPVNKLMTSWTKQQGYPVVSVKVNNQKLEFDQVPLHPTFLLVPCCDYFQREKPLYVL